MKKKVSIFWFRRDLRITDNQALFNALNSKHPILPIFIFDKNIIDELPKTDARVTFIYDTLKTIYNDLNTCLHCFSGTPKEVFGQLLMDFDVQEVYANKDYEPYSIKRDKEIKELLKAVNIDFKLYKDHVIFETNEVLKNDNTPYTVYTPYKNKWLEKFSNKTLINFTPSNYNNVFTKKSEFPELNELGFKRSNLKVNPFNIDNLDNYSIERDFPEANATSNLSPHLRFGTVSIRQIIKKTKTHSTFLSELIWREFFIQILFHFPDSVSNNFKKKYDAVNWRNNVEEFEKWKNGETGYPLVDAGMRELNATGYMHNRVRMVTAGFLCKHLLIDWRWGEAYFASKLLDYELASNNGNWQWSAGTGCDAAPYFRVFNPTTQIKRFDPNLTYIKKWLPELNSFNYPQPIVDHKFARERAISTYKNALS